MNKQLVVLTTSDLENMHKIQLNMLIEFDKICRRNNIKYILDAGTLLGAVRHKGFIPWDDDIDVRMLRDDYEKFCVVANKELPETMFFQNYKNDKGYPWMYSKIRMKGTKAVRIGQDRLNMEYIWIYSLVMEFRMIIKKRKSITDWLKYIEKYCMQELENILVINGMRDYGGLWYALYQEVMCISRVINL